ncbi:MAG: glycosyltransferase family 2 protein [Gammaproteobacteria bacterium]|nr:glycosyltransferase family 2 protein [Gammaproteobacteria bacterium]
MNTKIRFLIIIPVYNMSAWIVDNIEILKKQTYTDFRCMIGDDLSTDNSLEVIKKAINGDSRFSLIPHKVKKYSLGNICTLIEMADADEDEVIVLIDGDDRLADENVLQKLSDVYNKEDCWLTYGSYSGLYGEIPDSICTPYPSFIVKNNCFRNVKWRASHLKTFKYKLWRRVQASALTISDKELFLAKCRALLLGQWRRWYHWRRIKRAELLDETFRFARRCSDKFITSPMLELAGEKAIFIPNILYYYRTYEKDLNFNVGKSRQKWYQRLTRSIIKHKPKYRKIAQL